MVVGRWAALVAGNESAGGLNPFDITYENEE